MITGQPSPLSNRVARELLFLRWIYLLEQASWQAGDDHVEKVVVTCTEHQLLPLFKNYLLLRLMVAIRAMDSIRSGLLDPAGAFGPSRLLALWYDGGLVYRPRLGQNWAVLDRWDEVMHVTDRWKDKCVPSMDSW